MKKSGFTLIELLGAIILLSLIFLVAFPAIVNVVKKNDKKIDETTEALIINGAKKMVDENKNSYELNNGSVYCVKIKKLISDKYVIEDLPSADDDNIDVEMYVKISVINNKYQYIVATNCTEQ